MKKATISYTKNNLSRLLGMVREGNSVLVTDRDVPVARIDPVDPATLSQADQQLLLERKGVIRAPRQPLDVEQYLSREKPAPRGGASVTEALIEERREGR